MKTLLSALAIILISGVVAFWVSNTNTPASVTNIPLEASKTTYARVMQSGTLRCGYFTWPPYFMTDANTGEHSGVFYDITMLLAKKLDLKVEWVGEMNFGTFLQDINQGKFDAECTGGWPTAHRGKYAAYSRPLYYIALVPFVHADDQRFDSLESLNSSDVTAVVIDGENSQFVRLERFPNMQETSQPQITNPAQLLLDVAAKKADVTFVDAYSGLKFSQANPGKVKPLFVNTPVKLIPQNYTLPLNDVAFKNMMNVASSELLLNNAIEPILQKYEAIPNTFYRVNAPFKSFGAPK